MTTEYKRPLPKITDHNRPFWDAAKNSELRMQRCADCGHIRYPILPACTVCLSPNTEWVRLSGRGEVFAKIVYHRAYNAAFADDLPYNVVMVQLEEGPRMYSNIVGTPNSEIQVGDPVEVTFDHVAEDAAIPRFRLASRKA